MTLYYVSCFVSFPQRMWTSSRPHLEHLPLQLRSQSFKQWEMKTSREEKWEEQRQLVTAIASLSTFPFLVQWQRPNCYFQLVSRLPFPMSSKCPILPRGLSSLEEGDVSQNGLYLNWGFLATPVHSFHYLSPIRCLWRVSNMQKWWRKSKVQSAWLT